MIIIAKVETNLLITAYVTLTGAILCFWIFSADWRWEISQSVKRWKSRREAKKRERLGR